MRVSRSRSRATARGWMWSWQVWPCWWPTRSMSPVAFRVWWWRTGWPG